MFNVPRGSPLRDPLTINLTTSLLGGSSYNVNLTGVSPQPAGCQVYFSATSPNVPFSATVAFSAIPHVIDVISSGQTFVADFWLQEIGTGIKSRLSVHQTVTAP